MGVTFIGPRTWSCERDEDGHRNYKIVHLVQCNPRDGPANALLGSGLPIPGTFWAFEDDVDSWAYCKQLATVTPLLKNEPNSYFEVEQTFSTKPDGKRCKDQQIEDPLLTPTQISGSFQQYQEEGIVDANGYPICNSAFETFKGPLNEWDKNRPTLKFQQNFPALELPTIMSAVDCVNSVAMWGLPPRTIKLSRFSWERKFYGACFYYYTRTFEFDIRYETFDRSLLDEGSKVLNGHWGRPNVMGEMQNQWYTDPIPGYLGLPNPDPNNPAHYIAFKDVKSENSRIIYSALNKGQPLQVTVTPGMPAADVANFVFVQKYNQFNFTAFGLPVTF